MSISFWLCLFVIKLYSCNDTFGKSFAVALDFEFFEHLVYPYRLIEGVIVRLELNSSEKVILCTGHTAAT